MLLVWKLEQVSFTTQAGGMTEWQTLQIYP